MTVNMLIQIDKLVQLLESPVFTCKYRPASYNRLLTLFRPSASTSRARKISSFVQVPVRSLDAIASVICLCSIEESFEQC